MSAAPFSSAGWCFSDSMVAAISRVWRPVSTSAAAMRVSSSKISALRRPRPTALTLVGHVAQALDQREAFALDLAQAGADGGQTRHDHAGAEGRQREQEQEHGGAARAGAERLDGFHADPAWLVSMAGGRWRTSDVVRAAAMFGGARWDRVTTATARITGVMRWGAGCLSGVMSSGRGSGLGRPRGLGARRGPSRIALMTTPTAPASTAARPRAQPVRRLHAPRVRARRGQGRPDRDGHAQRVRAPDALRPERGVPAGHDEEGAPEVDHPGAAVVPARRLQRQVAAGAWRARSGTSGRDEDGDLGPVYGVQWRSWPKAGGEHVDQIAEVVEHAEDQPGFAPASSSSRGTWRDLDQMALMPCHAFFQFYVADGKLSLPAVPAQRRYLPGRALQHRELRAADAHDGAAVRAGGLGLHLDGRGLPHLLNHFEQVETAAVAQPLPVSNDATSSASRGSIFDYEFEDFEPAGTTSTTRRSRRRWRRERREP